MLHPLAEDAGEPRADRVCRRPWTQAANHAQPRGDRLAEQRGVAVDERFLLERDEHVRRVAAQRLAEESRRRDASDGERAPLDEERGADDRRIAAVGALPGVMAQHEDRRRRRRVVRGGEDAAAECADAEGREVIAGDVLRAQRSRGRVDVLPAGADAPDAGLKRRDLLELGHLALQPLVQRIREHPPAFLRAALHAAVGAVADPVEARRVADRERTQHHGMDQREDGGGAADAERQREDRGCREDACNPELPQRVADFAEKSAHCDA